MVRGLAEAVLVVVTVAEGAADELDLDDAN
jgi:hypothetical protein